MSFYIKLVCLLHPVSYAHGRLVRERQFVLFPRLLVIF